METPVLVSLLDEDVQTHQRTRTWPDKIPLRSLEQSHPETFEAVVDLFRQVAGGFIGNLIDKSFSDAGRYIQNVIAYRDDTERDILHRHLIKCGANFKRQLYGFSTDPDHIHVFHDCPFSSGACKCFWRRNLPCGQLVSGYTGRRPMAELGRRDWIHIVLYFILKKRGLCEIWIGGEAQGLQDSSTDLRPVEVQRRLREILARYEEENRPTSNNGLTIDGSSGESDEDHEGGSSWKRGKRDTGPRKKGKWERIQAQVASLMEDTAISPIQCIKTTKKFLQSSFLTNPQHEKMVEKALEVWSTNINNYSLKQFEEMYYSEEGPKDLVFSVSKDYYPKMEDSVKIVDDLLRFQMDNDEGSIKYFLQSLVDVLDKQPVREGCIANLKRNTFVVQSAPSAGKNFFFDMIFTFMLNMGQLGSANRHNNFAFQEAFEKRVILWNEPNYESSMTDYIKTLFEGGDTMVRRKGLPDGHVKRTPIIVLTNPVVPFMADIAFKERIIVFKWKPAPFLKNEQYKPYPLAFFEILKKYEINY